MSSLRRLTASLLGAMLAAALTGCGGGRPVGRTLADERRSPEVERQGGAPSTRGTGPGGETVAPHEVENNRWRQRRELTERDRLLAEQGAVRIRLALEQLRARNEFSADEVTRALLGLGYDRGAVDVRPFDTPPGAVYGVRLGAAGCIHGDLRPERVLVEVAGPTAESGCIEPPVGH